MGLRRFGLELEGAGPLTPDPLDILEQRIESAVAGFEVREGVSWSEVEELLNEGYGRLLSAEAVCARLARQLEEDVPGDAGQQGTAERRELEQFHSTMLGDAERLRMSLSRFKARGLEARRRFARSD